VEVGVTFDETVDLSTLVPANFSLSSGTITGLTVVTNGWGTYQSAVLQTTGLAPGGSATLRIQNVGDLYGQKWTTPTNVNFSVGQVSWSETGTPIAPGQVVAVGTNGFDVLNGGREEWANYDEVTIASVPKTNDFDVQVQVVYAEPSSKWGRNGLIARNNLDVGESVGDLTNGVSTASAYAQTHVDPALDLADTGLWPASDPIQPANPGSNDSHEQNQRLTAGGVTSGWGNPTGVPLYPNVWLRLKRVGTNIFGFRSDDGVFWIAQGSTSLTDQTNVMFVGPEFSAELGNVWGGNFDVWGSPYDPVYDRLFVTQFRNFGDVPGAVATPSNLTFSSSSGELTIGWTVAGTLQQSAALGAGAAWSSVAGAPNTPSGGSVMVTLPKTGSMFYRLLEQ